MPDLKLFTFISLVHLILNLYVSAFITLILYLLKLNLKEMKVICPCQLVNSQARILNLVYWSNSHGISLGLLKM